MRFGLIDIGSNSVKCNIHEYIPETGDLKLLLTRSATLGLIQYVKDGVMQEAGIEALLRTIAEYRTLTEELHGNRVVCVATASLRNLKNGEDICHRVRREQGCAMRIIPASEEARLGFHAACASLGLTDKRGILVDMGGASTELTAFEDGEVRHFVSLPLGCLALYMAHVSSVLPDKSERKAIRAAVRALLAQVPWLSEYGHHLYLIGGTAKTMGRLVSERFDLPWQDGFTFTAEQMEAFYRAYRDPGKKKIRAMIAVAPDRLHTFLPGLIAYRCLSEAAGAQALTVTFAGLRDGLALSVLKDLEEGV